MNIIEVWIVKYTLTKGVYKIRAEKCNEKEYGDMIDRINDKGFTIYDYYHGKDKEYCLTKEDAIIVANKMRLKKIDSLKNQIKKLESLDFND